MRPSRNAPLRILIVLCALVGCPWTAPSTASDWSGASGNWSSNASPGWNGTGVPNAVGAIAQKLGSGTLTTTQDDSVSYLTVGTINLGGSANDTWTVASSSWLDTTLNQDGTGAGFATISNTNSAAGTSNALKLTGAGNGTGNLVLADNLLITNTGGSTNPQGAIQITRPITGKGNITIQNSVNTFPAIDLDGAGSIVLDKPNPLVGFVGNTLIQKGLVSIRQENVFGSNPSNLLTLGQAGQGGVTLLATGANNFVRIPNPIVVAAGTGGTTILGSNSSSCYFLVEANITLNGNLAITAPASLNLSQGPTYLRGIVGAGGITHFGNGAGGAGLSMLCGENSYAGPTTIASGTLEFARRVALYFGHMPSWTSAKLQVNSGATASFRVGDSDGFTAADIQFLSALGTATGGFKNGSSIGLNTANSDFTYAGNISNPAGGANSLGLVKIGGKKLTLSGTNTYTGPTTVDSGTLHFANPAAFYNHAYASWTEANLTVKAIAMFSVGGPGEFTAADIDQVVSLTTSAPGGFQFGSTLAFDTTGAVSGVFAYGGNITEPSSSDKNTSGVNLGKYGVNTLTLSGANSYRGSTWVYDGTLKMTGSHSTNSKYASYGTSPQGGTSRRLVFEQATLSLPNGRISCNGGECTQIGGSITASDLIVSAGTYNLLSGTTTLSDRLSVQNGTMNNYGTIKSFSVTAGAVTDGTLNNYGTINCTTITLNSAGTTNIGTLNNSATLTATGNILIGTASTGANFRLNNLHSGALSGLNLIVSGNGVVSNAGSIALNGNAQFSAGGKYVWQLAALSTTNPGDDFGMLTLAGNLILGGTSKLELDFSLLGDDAPDGSNPFWDTNHTWKIINTTTNTGGTNFSTLLNPTFSSGYFTTTVDTTVAEFGDIYLNFIAVNPLHPGDFDSDGDVDGADFVAWQTNFPLASGATLGQGDADGDGDVDGADFVVWQTNFPFTPGAGASPVPEPAALLLGVFSAAALLVTHRRSRPRAR
jgi:autotransporter-associated beta strand protein